MHLNCKFSTVLWRWNFCLVDHRPTWSIPENAWTFPLLCYTQKSRRITPCQLALRELINPFNAFATIKWASYDNRLQIPPTLATTLRLYPDHANKRERASGITASLLLGNTKLRLFWHHDFQKWLWAPLGHKFRKNQFYIPMTTYFFPAIQNGQKYLKWVKVINCFSFYLMRQSWWCFQM